MKITPLPPTDVANIAPLTRAEKYERLVRHQKPYIEWSYTAVRNNLPKLLNGVAPLFGDLPSDDPEKILERIRKDCKKGEEEIQANEGIARALVRWVKDQGVRSRKIEINPYRTSAGSLRFAQPHALILSSGVFVPFFDMRRTYSLTEVGMDFLFSANYHMYIHGDLCDAQLAVLKFRGAVSGRRTVKFIPFGGQPIYSFDDVDFLVKETYDVWEEVLTERRRAGEKRTGTHGGLFQ